MKSACHTPKNAITAFLGIVLPILFLVFPAIVFAVAPQNAKLIQWGWDTPEPQFVKNNREAMEQMPFDGIGVRFIYESLNDGGVDLGWFVFQSKESLNYGHPKLQSDISTLKSIPFQKFTDNFIRIVPSTSHETDAIDWFDDWSIYLGNVKTATRAVKAAGLKGFIIDTEAYGSKSLWSYDGRKYHSTKTLDEYKAQARKRGKEVMNAMIADGGYPDIIIKLTYGHSILTVPPCSPNYDHRTAYALLPSFIDGMLEEISSQDIKGLPYHTLIDGYEFSYACRTDQDFVTASDRIKIDGKAVSSVPDLYAKYLKVGFGNWIDSYSNKNDCDARRSWKTDPTQFNCNWFTPDELKTALTSALSRSESYVWIYQQQPKWWPREKLPQRYIDAVRDAKNIAQGRPRGQILGYAGKQADGVINGWAVDYDTPEKSIDVHFYIDCPSTSSTDNCLFLGSTKADFPSPTINAEHGITAGKHRFSYRIPDSYLDSNGATKNLRDGRPHTLLIKGIDTGGNGGFLLNASYPFTFTLSGASSIPPTQNSLKYFGYYGVTPTNDGFSAVGNIVLQVEITDIDKTAQAGKKGSLNLSPCHFLTGAISGGNCGPGTRQLNLSIWQDWLNASVDGKTRKQILENAYRDGKLVMLVFPDEPRFTLTNDEIGQIARQLKNDFPQIPIFLNESNRGILGREF